MARKKDSDPKTTTNDAPASEEKPKGESLAKRIRARIKSALRRHQADQVSGNGDGSGGRGARPKSQPGEAATAPVALEVATERKGAASITQPQQSDAQTRAAAPPEVAPAEQARAGEVVAEATGAAPVAEEPVEGGESSSLPEIPTAAPASAVARAQAPEPAETKVSLLVRDPVWIYAYWELTRDKRELFRVNHRKMALRVFDLGEPGAVDKDASNFFDIGVMPKTRGWYIRTPRSHRVWKVVVGVFDSDGNYLPICESNVVETPRAPIEPASRVAGPVWNIDTEEGSLPAPATRRSTPAMPRFQEPSYPAGVETLAGPQPAPVREGYGPGEQAWTAEEERLREIFFASLGDEEEDFTIPGASELGSRRRSRSELRERETVRLRELRLGGASELTPGASNLGVPKKR